ncbi:MAG: SDR family NAD(P)-dependent oxidoreductase [Pseudomonas sp.]
MNAVWQSFSMTGKSVLVTEACSGLGAHVARLLSRAGARVTIGARRVEQLEQLAADLQWEGGEVLAVALDVSQRDSVEAALDAVEARFGCIDVLINTASNERCLEASEERSSTLLATSLDAVRRVTQCASRRMLEAGRDGSIIIVSPHVVPLGAGLGHWNRTKAGVIQVSQSMAEKLARHRIRVNALAPGRFMSGSHPGSLEELNGPLLLLASDAGACMTGAVLHVDGVDLAKRG